MSNKRVLQILAVWLCLAVAVGMAGWFEGAGAPAVAGTVWTLTALALLACWQVPGFKEWARTVDLRWLVLLHVTRFVGLYFLYLYGRGELPLRFAVPAGTGDIATATLAILLLALSGARKWKTLIAWNALGFIDILFVVFNALRIGLEDWHSMHALREFPLSLLPTFLVPLIIVSHILIFFRAARLALKKTSP